MYFHQGSKNLKFLNMIYLLLNLSKIEIYILFVYGSIIMKMDNSHLFQVILNFLFHAWEVMDNEIYNEHGFFSYIYACVDVVHFAMDLVT
jgi:hypothetical protein